MVFSERLEPTNVMVLSRLLYQVMNKIFLCNYLKLVLMQETFSTNLSEQYLANNHYFNFVSDCLPVIQSCYSCPFKALMNPFFTVLSDALRDLVPFVQFKKREKHP